MRTSLWISQLALILIATASVHVATAHAADATPTDVYAAVDRLNRSVEAILSVRGVSAPEIPDTLESGLGPMHVYQMHLACIRSLQKFEAQSKVSQIPLIVGRPMKYTPADVLMLTQLMTADVMRVASLANIGNLPRSTRKFLEKKPDDVFQEVLNLYVNLRALSDSTKITPGEVCAEVVRAVSDARAVLAQIDPARRYRIDVPADTQSRTPADCFARCLQVRATINSVRRELELGETTIPTTKAGRSLRPEDVFIQTQIIIAELNLIKLGTGTNTATPMAKNVSGKTPSDVYQQVSMLNYLLKQIRGMRQLTGSEVPAA